MAKYSYGELKKAAANGSRIGGWQGTNVYACSKYDYDATSYHFYVLYDDDNKLVRKGLVYGSINEKGTIHEVDAPFPYFVPKKKKPTPAPVVEYTVPATGYSAYMAGIPANATEGSVSNDDFFLRIDREINELLANVGKVDLSVSFGAEG